MDIALFVEQVAWFGSSGLLRDSSRWGVLQWLGDRLSPPVRQRWVRSLPILNPKQEEAETLLVQAISRPLDRRVSCAVASELPMRSVDWTATYSRAAATGLRIPQQYIGTKPSRVPDLALLGALASIGNGWLTALEWFLAAMQAEDTSGNTFSLQLRAKRLRDSLRALDHLQVRPRPMDARITDRLRGSGAEGVRLADALDAVARFWGEAFEGDADRSALNSLGLRLAEADVDNADTLLELTAALSIARAAVDTDQPAGRWEGAPWRLLPIDAGGRGKYPALRMRSGSLHCAIEKGRPRRGDTPSSGVFEDLSSPWFDEVLSGGEARATGRQPDIVLRFWDERRPRRVVIALGDAKRNSSGDGTGYLRASVQVAGMYLIAYAHALGLTLEESSGRSIHRTLLAPGVTLFCRQGSTRSADDAIALLEGPPERVPTVMAFDLPTHLVMTAAPWTSPTLTAWFRCLATQAKNHLR